jgi:pimeloyl-ACP methyl ester carboxylesterase
MTPDMEHHYEQINGIRLHYAAAGSGKPILFVHGWPEAWFAWEEQLAEFARTHRAVALDTRGINESERPAEVAAYHARHLVEDLRQLIAHLGGRAIVVAHDWGGAVAWNLAAQHPDCVEKLVIINSPHPVLFAQALANDPEQRAASQYMRLLRDPKAERVLSENNFARLLGQFKGWQRSANPPKPGTLERYLHALQLPGALSAGLNYYRASPLYPPLPGETGPELNLPAGAFTVRVPTLVIWGDQDTALRPVLLEGLDRYVPDLRIEHIPEGSHWVAHEFPQRVNTLIRAFIGA